MELEANISGDREAELQRREAIKRYQASEQYETDKRERVQL
jgi:hypothetical protein